MSGNVVELEHDSATTTLQMRGAPEKVCEIVQTSWRLDHVAAYPPPR